MCPVLKTLHQIVEVVTLVSFAMKLQVTAILFDGVNATVRLETFDIQTKLQKIGQISDIVLMECFCV